MSALFPSSISVMGFDIPAKYVAGAVTLLVIFCCGCCYCRCRKKTKIVASEQFKWPSSSRFLKKTDPGHPPKLVVNKYDAELRSDTIPEDRESFWIAKYQPNGDREEVRCQMYLRWRDGIVFGVGLEKVRQLCKISGQYKYNRASNQTVLVMTCKFSNELDTVMFHGCGNGTSFMGNCYMHEIDRFALMADVPVIRQASACKFKGSFLFQKMDSMGDPSFRMRLHSRGVHKWAGPLFPDEMITPPTSPLQSSKGRAESRYTPVQRGDGNRVGNPGSRRGSMTPRRGRKRRFLAKLNPFSGRKQSRHVEFGVLTPTTSADGRAGEFEREFPPWVQKGAEDDDEEEDNYGGASSRGRLPVSPARAIARSSSVPPIDNMNYLEIDGVPGRNGPAMV